MGCRESGVEERATLLPKFAFTENHTGLATDVRGVHFVDGMLWKRIRLHYLGCQCLMWREYRVSDRSIGCYGLTGSLMIICRSGAIGQISIKYISPRPYLRQIRVKVLAGCVSYGLVLYISASAGIVPNNVLNGGALSDPC